MHQYPYYEPDAGRHMVSEAETRALLDFMLKHRNIAAILTFGESDNLIATPARRGDLAAADPINLIDFAEQSTADARRVGMFAGHGRRRPGGRGGGGGVFVMERRRGGRARRPRRRPARRAGAAPSQRRTTVNRGRTTTSTLRVDQRQVPRTDRPARTGVTRAPAGAFFEYGYYQFGVPSFSTPGWGLPGARAAGRLRRRRSGAAAPCRRRRPRRPARRRRAAVHGPAGARRRAADAPRASTSGCCSGWTRRRSTASSQWTPFKHPTLGDVEIGGFKPYVTTNPPAAKIAELGAAHTKFVVYLTSLFPKVAIAKAEATALAPASTASRPTSRTPASCRRPWRRASRPGP